MRVVLADLKGTRGFVSKDTVAGGYGSRLRPFSFVTSVMGGLKRRLHAPPSVQMAYLAALAADRGHDVIWTSDAPVGWRCRTDAVLARRSSSGDGVGRCDAAAWGRVGFVGLAASKMPELFREHADFLIAGEPEEAAARLFDGQTLSGLVASAALDDLDALPFPRWDLIGQKRARQGRGESHRAADRRRFPGARQPRLPGVLHVLSAPDPRRTP
jgi:hypothetical protein